MTYYRSARSQWALAISLAVCTSTLAASAAPAQTKPARSQPANVLTGTLKSLDAENATIVVKAKSGKETPYRLTDKTQCWKNRKSVESTDFAPGESVVVRFRKSSVGPATLYDLADSATWTWLDRLRHETTPVTVKAIDEESLLTAEGDAEFTYRVTEKTQWSRGTKQAAPEDFKPGDRIFVVPRLLPGGGTMAIAVSDVSGEAAKLKERARYTVSGTIRVWNADKRTLALLSAAGDERQHELLPDCVIRLSGKDVPASYLRPGLSVTLHLTRDDSGEQVIRQITIKKVATKSAAKKPSPGLTPRKP